MNRLVPFIHPPSGVAAATAATPIISNQLLRLLRDPDFVDLLSANETRPIHGGNKLARVVLQRMEPEESRNG